MLDATLHDLARLRPLLVALRDALNPLIGELSPPASVAPPPAMPANDDQAEPLLTQGSVSAFARELLSGELLGVKPGPMLTTDGYRLYAWWCECRGLSPTTLSTFAQTLGKLGVTLARKRWADETGRVMNQAGVLIWPGVPVPATESQRLLGRAILESKRRIASIVQA